MGKADSENPMDEVFSLLRTEGREHVGRITELLLSWEKGEIGAEGLDELFRAAHSLKGAASTLGVEDVAAIAHAMEDVFGAVKRGEVKYDEAAGNEVLAAVDAISTLLDGATPEKPAEGLAEAEVVAARVRGLLAAGAAGEIPPAAAKGEGRAAAPGSDAVAKVGGARTGVKTDETVRLPVAKLDAVVDGFSELWEEKFRNDDLGVTLNRVTASARTTSKLLDEALELYRRRADAGEFFQHVERAATAANSVEREMRALDFDFDARRKKFELDLTGFGDELGRLRMAPLKPLFQGFRRPVRDLAVRLGKKVRLDIVGEDNELDKAIIEVMKDPLNHILRNAVHHGIEDEDTRRAAGKPAEGRVVISSTRVGSRLLIEVEDDGRGIDLQKLKEVALAAGVIRAEAADGLSPEEIARLVFEPGVTTLEGVDEVGGRGVGLDVVATNVAALGGTVEVWSETGVGTRLTTQIPLTIATARGMLVEAGGQKFIIPSSAIRRVELVSADDFETVEGKTVLRYQGRVLAAGDLSNVLGMGGERGREGASTVIVLSSPAGEAAAVVSRVWLEGEFLTKDLGPAARVMPYFGAAHVTGEGAVTLILNPDALIRELVQGEVEWRAAAAPEAEPRKRTVLVVDDSLTTRVLEKNILEAAGYDVAVATSGREALDILGQMECDLAIVDIQMPQMDGYELTRRIRASADYRDLPVVIVTSMDAERDVARGLEAGADAYIKKSSFDQRELLSVIEQFI
jgi:two-component system chemotaxis sensor kinase CheA